MAPQCKGEESKGDDSCTLLVINLSVLSTSKMWKHFQGHSGIHFN